MADPWDLISTPAQPAQSAAPGWDAISAPAGTAPASGVSMGPNGVLRVQMGNPEPKMVPAAQPDRSGLSITPDAFVRGAADMLTLGHADEISAAGDAALNPIFGTGAAGASFGDRYSKNVAAQRAIDTADQQQQTLPRIAGQVAGGLALPGAAAESLAGRAAVGAATGGVYGFGSGEGLNDSLSQGVTGAVLGGAAGAVAPYLFQGLAAAGNAGLNAAGKVIAPIRGLINPEAEAARRVTGALTRDVKAGDYAPATDLRAGQANGQPLAVGDVGGQTTRALARSAANTSPEARIALEKTAGNRFDSQGERTTSFLRALTGAGGDHEGTIEALRTAADRAASPRYRKVMAAHPVVSVPTDITDRPVVQQAMKDAVSLAKNRGEKLEAPKEVRTILSGDGYHIADDVSEPGKTSLRYWDYVKKAIDARINGMMRKGGIEELESKEKADLGGLIDAKRALVEHLDRAAPGYKEARATAARFFGAEDAMDAGRNFVSANVGNAEAARELAKMSPPERELFRQGFASELIRRVQESSDKRSVLNQIFLGASPAARERIQIALGSDQAGKLEAFLRVENIMDMMRTAIRGNSTTARQLAELGLAGGYGAVTGDWKDAGAGYLLVNGLRLGGKHIDQNVARRVGEMLSSNDPAVLQKALAGASRNTAMMDAIRAAETKLTGLIGASASGAGGHALSNAGRKLLTAPPSAADEQNKP